MAVTRSLSGIENQVAAAEKEVKAGAKCSDVPRKPNPLWKYMGLGENFHPRLPSRNWIIFLSVIGSFTATVVYDKREKKRNQRKWCKLIEHDAKEPLDPRTMPRKLTIFLQAPPMDGLRSAQDHFKEYVKPILVSSGLDWEFVQGRKEGDIREKVAERIRDLRSLPDTQIEKDSVAGFRKKNGIKYFEGPGGDIVIGRHTWKEYIQGLHEGWLSPISEESGLLIGANQEQKVPSNGSETLSKNAMSQDDTPPNSEPKATENASRFHIDSALYPEISLPPEIPFELEPSMPVRFPHILGFLNTPKRIYRFLNRRELADSIGRDTAAVILSFYRPYHDSVNPNISKPSSDNSKIQIENKAGYTSLEVEQESILKNEEKDWHKSVWASTNEGPEKIWASPIILDPRIASRMRKFELSIEDECKSNSIQVPEEEIEGWIKGGIRNVWRAGKTHFGEFKTQLNAWYVNKMSTKTPPFELLG